MPIAHRGPLRGVPPTGREFRCRMVALFFFAADGIVCERVYFDSGNILRQLGLMPELTAAPGAYRRRPRPRRAAR